MKTAKKYSDRLHILEIVLLGVLGVFLLSGAVSLRQQEALAEKVVRLHVLANSDSEEDQALKLRVRDAVLAEAEALLESAQDRAAAMEILQTQLPRLEETAAEAVAANGYRYGVDVRLETAEFPTKEYDGFTLPAGEYLALRVLIGEAAGQNWWCVVFPPLCTAAAADVPVTAMSAGMSGEQVRLITEENTGYVLKFKCVELWQQLKERFEGEGQP